MESMASDPYRDYLELYEYFGRGGLIKLTRPQFLSFEEELADLVVLAPNLEKEQLERVQALKTVLLRDRPLLKDLVKKR
jgi:hypothetical protein